MDSYSKPIFAKRDGDVFYEMRNEVNEIVNRLTPERKNKLIIKAIVFPAIYFALYFAALTWGTNPALFYICYSLMGVFIVINFLNLIHEAVHNALFSSKVLNNWYVYLFDLMGANSYIWKIRHIRLHHNYPNIMGWDSDIEQSPLARIFPHSEHLKVHKYQHLYLPVLYPLFVINWLLVRDFKDFFNRNRMVWKVVNIPVIEFIKLFFFKFLFVFYTLVLPVLVVGISWSVAFTAFFIMLFSASLVALIVLLSPHANTSSEFPVPDKEGNLENDWLVHQLSTTNDIKEDNWFTRFFMGCFNYHIAHHLFPNVNHIFYPEVTEIIQRYAREHNLPYRKLSLARSLRNHYRLLKSNTQPENIFEETM